MTLKCVQVDLKHQKLVSDKRNSFINHSRPPVINKDSHRINGYSKQKKLNDSMDITDEFDDEAANKPVIQETKGIL